MPMRPLHLLKLAVLLAAVRPTVTAQERPQLAPLVEDFESGSSSVGWTFGCLNPDTIETGGNPGQYLRNNHIASAAPKLSCTFSTESQVREAFKHGLVKSISIDAITHWVNYGLTQYPFAVLLRSTHNTPDPSDDDVAYALGSRIPQVGDPWQTHCFDIPSAMSDAMPPGWVGGSSQGMGRFRQGLAWSDFIKQVDAIEFYWGDPSQLTVVQDWDLGADNITVTFSGPSAGMK